MSKYVIGDSVQIISGDFKTAIGKITNIVDDWDGNKLYQISGLGILMEEEGLCLGYIPGRGEQEENNVSTFSKEEPKRLTADDLERIKRLMFPPRDPTPEWMTREFVGGMLGGIRIILNPSLPDDTMIVSRRLFESLIQECKPKD